MVQYSSSSVHDGSLSGPVTGIVDLDMALFGGEWKLFATNEADDSISVLNILDANGATPSGAATTVPAANFSATNLDIVSANGGEYAIFTGDGAGFHTNYEITSTGQIGPSYLLLPLSGHVGELETISTASVGGQTLVATSQEGQSGFTIQRSPFDLELFLIQNVAVPGGDIADVELISFGATGLAIAIDRADNKILSYTVAGNGTLTAADTLGVSDGLSMIEPDILRIVDVAGKNFGVVAAGSSSSISVFEIADDGQLTARDHVIDGQGTRFASISELAVVEADGRTFILAAGSDDGMTLLELLPDGRMIHHATIDSADASTLQNISAVTGEAHDGTLHVFVASETEAGLTELTFDLGSTGMVQDAGSGADTINGGAGDDVLFGGHGDDDDVLFGHDGDDILVAGHGVDSLTGGLGADVFVFGNSPDGGQVEDFNVAHDMLDLSGLSLLQDASQLNYTSYQNRVDVSFQGYNITVFSHNGRDLDPDDVADRIIINPGHSIISETPASANLNDTHHGTAGDDVLFGNADQDVFYASTGADIYVGGGDFDMVTFENATNRIKFDFEGPRKQNRGEIRDDKLYSIEGVEGTDFQDVLKGNLRDNWFDGGDGGDILAGRKGHDQLQGGAGDDILNGGDGRDTLTGGSGDDVLYGGRGVDAFHFASGRDKIKDFTILKDTLHIDGALLADPTMTASEVLDTYGRDLGRKVLLDFGLDGNGDSQMIILQGVRNLDVLTDSLFVF